MNGNEITNKHWDFFYECYLLTTCKKWGTSYLTKNFFKEIGRHLASKILLIVAFKDNQMIASALNFISDSCLYGRLWGTIKYIPYLHFELCYYQAIDYAIKNKIKNVEAGAQGSHKLQRGYLPKETYSLHWIKDTKFKHAINDFIHKEDSILKIQEKEYGEFIPYKKI